MYDRVVVILPKLENQIALYDAQSKELSDKRRMNQNVAPMQCVQWWKSLQKMEEQIPQKNTQRNILIKQSIVFKRFINFMNQNL